MEQEMWVARDKDGEFAMYENKPFKDERAEQWSLGGWWGFYLKIGFPKYNGRTKSRRRLNLKS